MNRLLPSRAAKPLTGFLNDALIVTLAAQILTLPLIAHYFGRLSVVSPLANLLVLPVQPAVMIWGGAAVILSLLSSLYPPPSPILGTGEPGSPLLATSRCSRSNTGSMVTPGGTTLRVAWIEPSCQQLRRRSSMGSIPSASASLFICISAAKWACGPPKPRNAPLGTLVV